MAYTGPGSGEWIAEQYRLARERERTRGYRDSQGRVLMWTSPNTGRAVPVQRKTSTVGGVVPVREKDNPPPDRPYNRPPPGPSPEQLQREAEARAAAREAARRRKAGVAFQNKAKNLEGQAKALLHALNVSFAKSRDQNLTDVSKVLGDQIELLKGQHEKRTQTLYDTARDNERAASGQSEQGFANLMRERQDTMAGLLTQGAGETDTLRAMAIAARNWNANQSEGNRAFFDSMRGVNRGLVDMNEDTRTAFSNAEQQAEQERERIWQNFYDRRSETYTQLGNVRQTQGDYMESAKEMDVGGGGGSYATKAGAAFMNAAKESGKSYVQKGIPQWVKDWEGAEEVDSRQSNTNLAARVRFQPIHQAEGAALRKWS
jgi:hypothetical protein